MPELPEAERARAQIEKALNREIVAVDDTDTYVCRPHAPGEIAQALTGHRLPRAHRRGQFPRAETDGGAAPGSPAPAGAAGAWGPRPTAGPTSACTWARPAGSSWTSHGTRRGTGSCWS